MVFREHSHGFVFTVGTKVDAGAVSQQDHQEVLSGVALRGIHTCGATAFSGVKSEGVSVRECAPGGKSECSIHTRVLHGDGDATSGTTRHARASTCMHAGTCTHPHAFRHMHTCTCAHANTHTHTHWERNSYLHTQSQI